MKRFIKNGLGTRKELPDNCPEYIGVYKAIKLFNKTTRPWLMEESASDNFIRINNYNELERILENF